MSLGARWGGRVPGLLKERAFRTYWTGQTVSLVGDQISLLALPLVAVLVLGADAAEMGWLKTVELLPALLLSLPAGAWADRRAERRRLMIVADLLRVLLVLSLPVAYALDALTLWQLYAVALGIGACAVVFDVCNATLLVALLPVRQYVAGNALVNGARSMAWLGGPGLGGILVQVLTAPVALVADALTYGWSAWCLARIRPREPEPSRPERGYFTAGLRWIFAQPSMRVLFAASATIQFFNFIFHTLFILYATQELGLSPGLFGLILSAGAVGGLLGAMGTGRVVRRIGVGPAIVAGFGLFSLPLVLVPLARGGEWLVVLCLFTAEFLSCVGAMLVDISSGSLQMALIPDVLRSRVTGAFRTLNHGFRPLGAIAGGVLGSALGLAPALWIATVGGTLSVVWTLGSSVSRTRALPGETGETGETEGTAGEAGGAGGARGAGGGKGGDAGECAVDGTSKTTA